MTDLERLLKILLHCQKEQEHVCNVRIDHNQISNFVRLIGQLTWKLPSLKRSVYLSRRDNNFLELCNEIFERVLHSRSYIHLPYGGAPSLLKSIVSLSHQKSKIFRYPANLQTSSLDIKDRELVTCGRRIEALPIDHKSKTIDFEQFEKIVEQEGDEKHLILLKSDKRIELSELEEVSKMCQNTSWTMLNEASFDFGYAIGDPIYFKKLMYGSNTFVLSSTSINFPAGPGSLLVFPDNYTDTEREKRLEYPSDLNNKELEYIPNQLARQAIAALELEVFGKDYSTQMNLNAKTLGTILQEEGVSLATVSSDTITNNHFVRLIMPKESTQEVLLRLNRAGILIDSSFTVNTAAITRLGLKTNDITDLAVIISRIIHRKEKPKETKRKIQELMTDFNQVHYSFDNEDMKLEELKLPRINTKNYMIETLTEMLRNIV